VEWQFCNNRFGRPHIANDRPDVCDLSFNVSHTNSLIAIGVTRGLAIGIDTENVYADRSPLGIADRVFAAEESAALWALPECARRRRFFEYWTLKESYLKARSMGLSFPLDTCTFRFTGTTGIEMSVGRQPPAEMVNRFARATPATAGLSNLGRLDADPHTEALRSKRSSSWRRPSALGDLAFSATSFTGRLQLNAMWPEPMLDERHARGIVDQVVMRLETAATTMTFDRTVARRFSPARPA
jgi:hypothetical protein